VTGASNVEIFTEHKITRIMGDSGVEGLEMEDLKTGEKKSLEVQGVFVEIGLLPNSELVIDTLQTNRVGEIVVDSRCRTGVAGVFACGDVTDVPYKQVVVAAGEGAKAGLSAHDYIITQK
jgi:alkyl hydroperoxide reductase subunit F